MQWLHVVSTMVAMDTTYAASLCLHVMSKQGVPTLKSSYGATRCAQQIANDCDMVLGGNSASRVAKTVSHSVALETSYIGRAALFFHKEAAA